MKKIIVVGENQRYFNDICEMINSLFTACDIIYVKLDSNSFSEIKRREADIIIIDSDFEGSIISNLFRNIKSNQISGHIPVIALSGFSYDVDTRKEGLELGIDAFLTKPLDKTELSVLLNIMFSILFLIFVYYLAKY